MENLELLEKRFIELLLQRCINFNKSKSLLIGFDKVNRDFVDKLVARAKELGVTDIYKDEEDIIEKRDILMNIELEEIDNHPYFNKRKWDEYALKDAAFLFLDTEFPHFMDDIDPKKLAKAQYVTRYSRPIYREKQLSYQIPWCITALPNEMWAQDIFKDDPNAYEKLYLNIMKFCMVDTLNPAASWDREIFRMKVFQNKLNDLQISKMWYKNSIGTDLTLELSEHAVWNSAASECKDGMFVNMPSYEIFTSPDYRKTEGIVYGTRPLVYNGGIIDEFYIEFEKGKAVNYKARVGNELLKGIINSDEGSCYLGEAALIDKNTPISKSGIVTGTVLLDENASPHLALGEGFTSAIKNGSNMSEEELRKLGINFSTLHVDFMIGSDDLNILADTNDGPKLILKDGSYNL